MYLLWRVSRLQISIALETLLPHWSHISNTCAWWVAHLELIPTSHKSQEKRHTSWVATELQAELMLVSSCTSQSLTAPLESDTHHDTSPHEHRVDYCTEHHSSKHVWSVCVNKSPSGELPAFQILCSHSPRDIWWRMQARQVNWDTDY